MFNNYIINGIPSLILMKYTDYYPDFQDIFFQWLKCCVFLDLKIQDEPAFKRIYSNIYHRWNL